MGNSATGFRVNAEGLSNGHCSPLVSLCHRMFRLLPATTSSPPLGAMTRTEPDGAPADPAVGSAFPAVLAA